MPLTQKKKSKVKDGKSNVPPKPEEDPISAKPALQENEAESSDVNVEGVARKPPRGSLKEFVEQFKDRHYYVVEMRIVLVCCMAVFFKLFFSEVILEADQHLTYSALGFIGLCVLVIIFSTWLDYFPSRLIDLQPRESKGQGLPLACLLLPMVCCAQLYFALHHAKHMAGLLQVYLVLLCFLCVCSILATLLHSVPHPNHVMLYNFAVIAMAFGIQMVLGVSLWVSLSAAALYSILGVWLLNAFPRSFTLGEAAIVSQALTLVALDTALQLFTLYDVVPVPEALKFSRSEPVLYAELLIVGVAMCCLLISPALYKLARARHYHERKFWSGSFILLSLSTGFMLVLPWLGQLLGGHNPIIYVFFSCASYPARLVLIGFWLVVCVVTGLVVHYTPPPSPSSSSSSPPSSSPSPSPSPSSSPPSSPSPSSSPSSSSDFPPWGLRKCFHLSALLVYLTGIAVDPNFISLAASLVTFLFLVAELVRIFRMWPCGDALHQFLLPFLNQSDSGPLIVSHLYLLLGFSLPLWLCPITNYNQVAKLSMYSGVLSLGVGDAVASIAGRLYGKVKWPGTKKTVEGSLAGLLAQLVGVFIITLADRHLPALSGRDWGIMTGSIAVTTLLEAYTWQIDNLVLAVFQYAILLTFLN